MICGQCQIVSPSTKTRPLLAADGDPGESDDDPGLDDLADEMMEEPLNGPPEDHAPDQDGNDTVVLVVRRCTQLCLPRGPHQPRREPALRVRLVAVPLTMRIPKSSLEFMGSGRHAH